MLDMRDISNVVKDSVSATFGAITYSRVMVAPTADSQGEAALDVLIVLNERGADDIEGDLVLDTLVRIQNDLHEVGEDRLAIVRFATEAELATLDDQP